DEYIDETIKDLSIHTDKVPSNEKEEKLDQALASVAIKTALKRHAGYLEETYTGFGLTYIQMGKDLTRVEKAIVTGGSLIHTKNTLDICSYATYKKEDGLSLRPKKVEVLLDYRYILASMGLLAMLYPDIALRIMKKELKSYGTTNLE
ncbi:MAG: glutamate mutase L, partial [Lachnospiraceae bacterium]|nr:glutamate mutase L [Lachnospiraceae bacterium]